MNLLPLYPGAEPCVNSGFCCRTASCPFGEWDAENHQCRFLTEENFCGKFEEIIQLPRDRWESSPAFGAGCSSTLFNESRQRILAGSPDLLARVLAARAIPIA